MDEFTATLVMIFLFALRCIVPLVLTLLIGRAMNRMVDKWEAEEAASKKEPEPLIPVAVSETMPVAVLTPLKQPGITASVRCWMFHDCGRTDCAAYQNPNLLCWKIKIEENGRLPDKCQQCAYYEMTNAPA
ncbi:MAG: hypothetical protein WAM60_24810 [Candidatus Promineifilaceae bacterium]